MIVNVAAYKFVELADLATLRAELRSLAKAQSLKGTILLSPEGINLFVAGMRKGIEALLARVRQIPGLADLDVKESASIEQPFNRMLVKIKREIIAFGIDGIQPAVYTSPRIAATELKRWLDEQRPVTLLDTRNDYEVQAGTFEKAVALDMDDFRNFPAAVERLPDELKQQTIVTFCTGGIRCEKAAPYLERAGFKKVFQLDGGILRYFEEVGGAHYRGECFVFDQRVAVNPQLRESDLRQCFACQAILTAEDRTSATFIEGESCPHCYKSPAEELASLIEARHAAIRSATSPLPGSIAYENVRPLNVPARFDGFELLDCLKSMRTHLSTDEWRVACAEGRLRRTGSPIQPGDRVRAGDRLLHIMPATREPDVAADIRVLHEDESIVVVGKPAPLPMHPCGRFNRNTLTSILNQVYTPLKLRPAHRLDADTSGVVVLSKTRDVARRLQPQFEAGQIDQTYLALVHGRPASNEFECCAPLAHEPGTDGVRLPEENGKPAVTHFSLLETNANGTSLVEVRPRTGRTNQIRVHLWSLGLPIVGDPIYRRDGELGRAQSLSVSDPPLCLHAARLSFDHPQSGARTSFEAPAPAWGS
jgi:RluA family pseudouridine synthase